MVFGGIVASPRSTLSSLQALELASVYLEGACKAKDVDIILVLCHDTEVSLSQAKRSAKHTEDQLVRRQIGVVYIKLGRLLYNQGHHSEAQTSYKKAEKLGVHVQEFDQGNFDRDNTIDSIKDTPDTIVDTIDVVGSSQIPSKSLRMQKNDIAVVSPHIFPKNIRPPTIDVKPPEPDTRLNDTPQLACCLALLQSPYGNEDILDLTTRTWLQVTRNEPDEQERLKILATDVIRAFKRDEFKDAKAVTEVVYLAPVLASNDFRYLLKEFCSGIDQSSLLDIHQLDGLAQLIQGADPGYLDSDDLVKILGLLSTRLRDTHQQSTNHLYELTLAVSYVLDAMADANVKGLDRETIHEPLASYLDKLKGSSDSYLVYQAAYAYQALMCVPDNETLWQAALRRTGRVVKGVSGLVSAVKGLDLNGFIDGLKDIQQGLAGAHEVVQLVKTAYEGVASLAEGGQGFLECLKEGLSFNRKCAWYPALRGADTLIQDGQLADFRKLVCEAPCRRDPAFQWGVCQRLGDIAANPTWDMETRQGAIAFLGEMYQDDDAWGDQANVKQWILDILMQLSSGPHAAESLLQELQTSGDATKQTFYQSCRARGSGLHPLRIIVAATTSQSLLDRVQERQDVEGQLRQLRRQRLKERGRVVYIPPQAKASLHTRDEARFPLAEKVEEFLASDQKVFLLLGDSGAGKSTFNRELECQLWQSYKKRGVIPLHINLPAIEKPEHDMIAKQLRKSEFTEPQIRELKLHREFVLICDGYDESQQNHNLYTSNRLNEPGEWSAKMVISCRSEYLGVDYQDRFQPGDRNQRSESTLFQEAVITPFSVDQVQDYIDQYVSVHRPLWEADEYKGALDLIPSLKELVRNPFLMSLSLEVLPRMVDPGQDLTATHITRVALYDQFIEHWLERGKKRLGEKNLSPQARAAFESLSDEGFTQNGIDYLKRLSVAIYKEQGGQPIVRYSRYKDESTWKADFFSREDEKQLLREACPLIRNGNQHRFIHRSLLEYGLALAVFDPQDWGERKFPESVLARRGSTSSSLSFDSDSSVDDALDTIERELDVDSPLAWRSFVNEPSVLQFLEERVQQEPLFKQQLFDYIEHSKTDKKWRKAASNAITILIRAGVQFNGADLRGIRVPKADLSHGIFDSAQLQGADLRQVNLRSVWLRKANLTGARLGGAQFGELPYLQQESEVSKSAFAPDGKSIAVGLDNGWINVYSTFNWKTLWSLDGHKTMVSSIIYSPNGTLVASGSEDGAMRLWNAETWVCRHVLTGHDDYIEYIIYSRKGDQIASASRDTTVKLFDVETGDCLRVLIGHTDWVLSVMYSSQDNQIASSSDDWTVRLWDIETGECQILEGHISWVKRVVYSLQGDTIASAGGDTCIRFWDVATGDCRQVLTGHRDCIDFLAYSPNGEQIVSSARDHTIRLWDAETGVCLHTLRGHGNWVLSASYSPSGDLIASASFDKTVRLWSVETGLCRQTLAGHSHAVRHAVFSPKGDQIASSSDDKTVRLWDVGAATFRHVTNGHSDTVWRIHRSPNGNQIATCSDDTTVRIWDLETGECVRTLRGHTKAVYSILYSPQGDQIATGSWDNTVRLWNPELGVCLRTLTDHNGEVNLISYSPQGDLLASSSDDWTVRIWEVSSGGCRYTLEGHTDVVNSVVFSPSGNQIASSSWDGTVRLWNIETGDCSWVLDGHSARIRRVVYSPQGDYVASSSDDNMVRIWDTATGTCRHTLTGHTDWVVPIVYSPSGDKVASGGKDSAVRIWDVETGACLQTMVGHSKEMDSLVYSPQGDVVVSASDDRTVRLWNVATGQCRAVIQDFSDCVKDTVWIETGDGPCIVTGCQDGSVWMWELMDDGDLYNVRLRWSSMNNGLAVTDAGIQDVQGLSQLNKQLLKQRGAIGEPVHRLRDASRRLTSMVSMVSKLKLPPQNKVEVVVSPTDSRPEQLTKQDADA